MIEKNKYEEIINTINEPYKNKENKPNFYGRHIFADKALILLDTPCKEGAYHGSSFTFNCHGDICSVNGEIVTKRKFEEDVSKKIIETSCDIIKIHRHPESILATPPGRELSEQEKESHIHFTCANKGYKSTIKIAKFLREY